jgi:hypothetical protein
MKVSVHMLHLFLMSVMTCRHPLTKQMIEEQRVRRAAQKEGTALETALLQQSLTFP